MFNLLVQAMGEGEVRGRREGMTREQALEAYKMAMDALEYDDALYHEEHGEVIVDKDVWEDAKKALEQTQWIPCSESLPEEDGCYLVTTTGTNNDIIDIAYYTEGIWHKASRIKAWMPLPEPYREDGDTDALQRL